MMSEDNNSFNTYYTKKSNERTAQSNRTKALQSIVQPNNKKLSITKESSAKVHPLSFLNQCFLEDFIQLKQK
jgi:hypothetical protein